MANLWWSMEKGADAMTYKIWNNPEAIIICMVFDDIPDFLQWYPRAANINCLVQALFGYLHQFASGLIDSTN